MYLKLSTNCISKKNNNEINKMISTQDNHEQNSTNNRTAESVKQPEILAKTIIKLSFAVDVKMVELEKNFQN
jgi:hypothetical protein